MIYECEDIIMHWKASVIVPVYNVEKYIDRCVDSILEQSYKNFELILVDDGSTDHSGRICDEYGKKDNWIHVIHQKNAGLSGARNTGIRYSTGDFLFFVDSDDYVSHHLLEKSLAAFEKSGADLIQFNGQSVYGTKLGDSFGYDIPRYMDNTDFLRNWFLLGEDSHACKRAYRRSSYPNLAFPLGLSYEDLYINTSSLLQAKNLCAISDVLYYYENEEHGSITQVKSVKNLLGLSRASMKAMTDLPDGARYKPYREMFRLQALIPLFYIWYHYKNDANYINKSMVQPQEVVELYSVLSQKADPWYSNSLEQMDPGMTQELSYAAHCLSLEYKIKIMGGLKLDIQQKEKDMAGYLIRLLSVDSVIHTLSANWKRKFIDMLEKYRNLKSLHLRVQQKVLLHSALFHMDMPLILEGKHLLKKGMQRE